VEHAGVAVRARARERDVALQLRREICAVNVRDCEEKVGGGAGFAIAMAMVHADISRRGSAMRKLQSDAICAGRSSAERTATDSRKSRFQVEIVTYRYLYKFQIGSWCTSIEAT
jgi:hypothetical protein